MGQNRNDEKNEGLKLQLFETNFFFTVTSSHCCHFATFSAGFRRKSGQNWTSHALSHAYKRPPRDEKGKTKRTKIMAPQLFLLRF